MDGYLGTKGDRLAQLPLVLVANDGRVDRRHALEQVLVSDLLTVPEWPSSFVRWDCVCAGGKNRVARGGGSVAKQDLWTRLALLRTRRLHAGGDVRERGLLPISERNLPGQSWRLLCVVSQA